MLVPNVSINFQVVVSKIVSYLIPVSPQDFIASVVILSMPGDFCLNCVSLLFFQHQPDVCLFLYLNSKIQFSRTK